MSGDIVSWNERKTLADELMLPRVRVLRARVIAADCVHDDRKASFKERKACA